jgi:hypothetical protein
MDTLPAATAVTSPEPETLAIPVFPELQLITRPESRLLLASRVTAESCTVPPTWRLDVAGDTDTDATGMGGGALTLRADDALIPSLEAEIIVVPGASAVTSPVAATVATFELELCQVTVRPESGFPFASSSVAVACAVCPTRTAEGVSATNIVAMGVGEGGITAMLA